MTNSDNGDDFESDSSARGVLKKGLDTLLGVEPSAIRDVVSDMMPREAAARLAQGTERTKKEVVRIIAGEVKGFLEEVDLQSIIAKVLQDHEMEVHIRFRPKPDAAAEVSIETDEPISADDNEP
mgnify:CR=1 FL=1|tara:strand:- start:2 stop:373 length:372 start_codon:yes stop_codon:yes gene_type:complete